MIKVSVFYPNKAGSRFDIDYYCNKHMPMVKTALGAACRRADIDQGLGGPTLGSQATYVAMCHLYFDSVEAFQNAFGPHSDTIMRDIPNYTDVQPIIQVSDVKG
jgi:uncharacterized protein (TIGR02118 family)